MRTKMRSGRAATAEATERNDAKPMRRNRATDAGEMLVQTDLFDPALSTDFPSPDDTKRFCELWKPESSEPRGRRRGRIRIILPDAARPGANAVFAFAEDAFASPLPPFDSDEWEEPELFPEIASETGDGAEYLFDFMKRRPLSIAERRIRAAAGRRAKRHARRLERTRPLFSFGGGVCLFGEGSTWEREGSDAVGHGRPSS